MSSESDKVLHSVFMDLSNNQKYASLSDLSAESIEKLTRFETMIKEHPFIIPAINVHNISLAKDLITQAKVTEIITADDETYLFSFLDDIR